VSVRRSPSTVTEALNALREAGYTVDYQLVDGSLRADGGNAPCPIGQAVVERFYRFEGPSDPGDQMIVYALRDPNTACADRSRRPTVPPPIPIFTTT
jgi:hypothetical protein